LRIDAQINILPDEIQMNVVTAFSNAYGSILTDLPNEMLSMKGGQPGIRVNELRKWRQAGKFWEGDTWWLIPTRECLVGSLQIGVKHEGFRGLPSLLKSTWARDLNALLVVGSMVAFYITVLLWLMWGTHVRLNAQTEEKAHKRRGKIAPCGCADKTGVTIKGDLRWHTMALEETDDRLEGGLCVKICLDL
jgi:hypothetical protein